MSRVLFVDHEPHVADALRDMLRGRRPAWGVTTACSAAEALDAMAEPVDVMVSSLRLGPNDGMELLREAGARHPGTLRIAFSGDTEVGSVLRSSTVAHRFLSKPVSAEVLIDVLDRATRLRAGFADPALLRLVGGVTELPTAPRIFRKLIAVADDPSAGRKEAARVVTQDLAVTTRLLRAVNSPFFGLRREVRDVEQAIVVAGMSMLRALTLAAEVETGLGAAAAAAGVDPERIALHSGRVSRLAAGMVDETVDREIAAMGGLLHDVGRLALAARLPGRIREIQAVAVTEGIGEAEAERRELGVTHADVGAYLLSLWGMPMGVVESAGHHHDPERFRHQAFGPSAAVYLACSLIRRREQPGSPCDPPPPEVLEIPQVAANLSRWESEADRLCRAAEEAA